MRSPTILARLALLSLTLLGACSPQAPDAFDGSVELFFRPEVGPAYFQCDELYGKITAVDLRFFVFDIRLVSDDGVEHDVEIPDDQKFQQAGFVLMDFEDATGECVGTPALNKTIKGTVTDWQDTGPITYSEVRFRIGVPPNRSPTAWLEELGKPQTFFSAWSTAGTGVALSSADCAGGGTCGSDSRPEIALPGFDIDTSTIVVDWGILLDPFAPTTCDPAGACVCDSPCVPTRGLYWSSSDSSGQPAVFHLE